MVLYITLLDFGDYAGTGKERKIRGQIDALKLMLKKIYYTTYSYPILYLMEGEKVIEKEAAVTSRDRTLILCHWMKKYNVKCTYIRYPRSNKWFYDLLKYQKEHHIVTVVEIPTYPYDGEFKEGIIKREDAFYREKIGKYINRIATYSADTSIWGTPCLHLNNGISASEINIYPKKREKKKIVLIAVSCMMYWHGYERILEGMYLYYKERNEYDIRLKMIGSGPEEISYKKLVQKFDLCSRVEFLGRIEVWEKDRLNKQYVSSDIAVSALGCYKKGIDEVSPIKDAEYCAKGLPIVSGCHNLGFPYDWEYMLNIPNSAQPVDMNKVISFYEKVTSKKNYELEMKDYAMNHLTWDSIMRPVGDYFIATKEL